MKIVVVRHGETNENALRYYLGHYNAPLNDKGKEQLKSFRQSLKQMIQTEERCYLYSSDLSRAVESAKIIGGHLPSVTHSALRELNFGNWECKTYETIQKEEPSHLDKWVSNPFKVAPPNGETLEELGKRVDDWLHYILTQHDPKDTLIIVSHQGPIRWLLSKYLLGDSSKFWEAEGLGHGSGIVLEYDIEQFKFTRLVNR